MSIVDIVGILFGLGAIVGAIVLIVRLRRRDRTTKFAPMDHPEPGKPSFSVAKADQQKGATQTDRGDFVVGGESS